MSTYINGYFSAAGISRSTTCVIAFLMKEFSWNFENTFNFMLSKHPVTHPNIGFVRQLQNYEAEIKKKNKKIINLKK